MKKIIFYGVTRVLSIVIPTLFLVIAIPIRRDVQNNLIYANTSEVLLSVMCAMLVGVVYVWTNLLILKRWMKKKKEEATRVIRKIKEDTRWEKYHDTVAALEIEYSFVRDCKENVWEIKNYKEMIDRRIDYLENDWKKELVVPSFFDSDYECWASEVGSLRALMSHIGRPVTLLDDIRETQKTFGETKEKIEKLVLEIPETQDSVVLSEIVRVKNKIQKVYAQYNDAASIQAKRRVINEMMDVFGELEILSDVVKISINDGKDATEIVKKYSDDIGMLLRILQGSLRSSSKETVV